LDSLAKILLAFSISPISLKSIFFISLSSLTAL